MRKNLFEQTVKQKTKNENEDIMTKTIKFCIENSLNEEKNIMKKVILFFDNSLNVSVEVYMSLETLNKIKRGEWEYPFIQYTNGKETFLEKVDNIFTIKILDEHTKNIDELEEKMYKCLELGKAYNFNILVDESNGF